MKIIDEYLAELQTQQEVVAISTITAVAMAVSIANIAFNAYKQHLTKSSRTCKNLPGKEKAICMLRAKLAAKQTQLAKAKSASGACAKSKDPNKCKKQVASRLKKISSDVKFLQSRFKELRGQKYKD